jgi:Uma2 family endonuclease
MVRLPETLISVEEYLARTQKPNAEYEDGVLYPKPMPTLSHSALQYAVTDLLRKQGVRAFPELTLRLSPSSFLVPDVVVERDIEEPYPANPPELCVEILSPEQGLGEMLGVSCWWRTREAGRRGCPPGRGIGRIAG